jgi:hypothetical protein
MEIKRFHLLTIDRENDSVQLIPIQDTTGDFVEYIRSQQHIIQTKKSVRGFKVRDSETAAISHIMTIIASEERAAAASETIARRLLQMEVRTAEKHPIANPKRGSLIVVLYEEEDQEFVLLLKVEHDPFIDESDLSRRIGLPIEKATLKSCLLEVAEDELGDINIFDSNITIARYWWDDFLELEELTSDENNTKKAFNEVEKLLRRKVGRKYKADYTILRNNAVGFFKTRDSFNVDDFLSYVIGDYEPENPELNIDKLKGDISDLPTKKQFDASFNIVSSEIKAKMRSSVKVNRYVELKIQDYIEDMPNIIHSKIGEDGKKYLMISADDEAYDKYQYTDQT